MDNGGDILRLCRLCLVKDDVNIPIFEEQGDIRQIFLKISSCLPVKVSREDKLPKKICDGCSYKLDMLYEFWNTTANAEKQLLSWLGEAGMNAKMADGTISAVAQQIKPVETFVKQEAIDPSDIHADDNDDDKSYMFQQKFAVEEAGPSATVTSNEEEPPPKRARRTAAVKAQIAMDPESDDDDDSGEPITKVEDESEESEGDDHEPPFVDVPSTSADDQPGPSGVGKDGVEAPKTRKLSRKILEKYVKRYDLKQCQLVLPDVTRCFQIVNNHTKLPRFKYKCYICSETFMTHVDLVFHKTKYKNKECKEFTKIKPKTSRKKKQKQPVKAKDIYTCKVCLKVFLTKTALRRHKHRLDTFDETVQVPEIVIPASITNEGVAELPPEFENRKVTVVRYQKRPPNQLINNSHLHCLRCERNFLVIEDLKEHVIRARCYSIRKCKVCFAPFEKNREMYDHVVQQHPEQLICEFCYKLFTNFGDLTFHKHGKHFMHFRQVCTPCSMGFITISDFRQHCKETH